MTITHLVLIATLTLALQRARSQRLALSRLRGERESLIRKNWSALF